MRDLHPKFLQCPILKFARIEYGLRAGVPLPMAYSAAFGKGIAGTTSGARDLPAGSSMRLPRRKSTANQLRRGRLRFSRVNTISMDGVTTRVSTVAKDRPNTIAEDSCIHHCVEGALIVVSRWKIS